MRRTYRHSLPALLLTLLALPAVFAAAGDADDGERRIVIKEKVDCDGEDCSEAEARVEKKVVFVGEDGEVTRLSGADLEWVEGEALGPHEVFVRRGGPGGTFLGVGLTELTPELRAHYGAGETGVMVSRVVEDSPAWRAGLEVGDLVTAIDGEPVASGRQLARAVRQREAGDVVDVEVLRDGGYETFTATLAENEDEVVKMKRVVVGGEGEDHARFDHLCAGLDECKVEVRCENEACDCKVNGEAVACE